MEETTTTRIIRFLASLVNQSVTRVNYEEEKEEFHSIVSQKMRQISRPSSTNCLLAFFLSFPRLLFQMLAVVFFLLKLNHPQPDMAAANLLTTGLAACHTNYILNTNIFFSCCPLPPLDLFFLPPPHPRIKLRNYYCCVLFPFYI